MQTEHTPSRAEIEHAASLLRAGKLVAFPTETVYGLGANALDEAAVRRIYEVKGRPSSSPIIVHVSSLEMAQTVVAEWPPKAQLLAKSFWPGPLTLVLKKQPTISPVITAGLDTVGVRMPRDITALRLIAAVKVPIAAPSANRFTELSPTTAKHVRAGLGDRVDYILDGGRCKVGIESTVLSLVDDQPVLLRYGGVQLLLIQRKIGPVRIHTEVPDEAHLAPGMFPKHYSPRTALLLCVNGNVPRQGRGAYLQLRTPPAAEVRETVQMADAAAGYAHDLYRVLHDLDVKGYDWIAVEAPPPSEEWRAVWDRLWRARHRAG
jgi:L-threonylcarbamoyladenylate synthase